MYIYVYIYKYVCVCIYIYVYVYMYIYVLITCTHTCTQHQINKLKQTHNTKQKEQLEKSAQQRVKIADEMRSAFRELQVCCSVLQGVAVCAVVYAAARQDRRCDALDVPQVAGVLQVCCSVSQCVAVCCSVCCGVSRSPI